MLGKFNNLDVIRIIVAKGICKFEELTKIELEDGSGYCFNLYGTFGQSFVRLSEDDRKYLGS
jgi:hypothetical protein